MAKTLLARLSDKMLVGDGCWEWIASKDSKGYGQLGGGGHTQRAHRVVYELLVGPIPAGMDLDHLCRNRGCVRPSHMEPCTRQENLHRSPIWNGNREVCPQGHARVFGQRCRECANALWRANYPRYKMQRAERRRRLNGGS